MLSAKKVTLYLPKDLLQRAQKVTGKKITPTVRQGLELLAVADACDELLTQRGKIKIRYDKKSLRADH